MQTFQQGRTRIGSEDLLAGTISVVSTFLQRSSVPTERLNQMIRSVNSAMLEVAKDSAFVECTLSGADFQKVLETASAKYGVRPTSLEPMAVAPVCHIVTEAPRNPATLHVATESGRLSEAKQPQEKRKRATGKKPRQVEIPIQAEVSSSQNTSESTHIASVRTPPKSGLNIKNSVRMNALICLEDGERVTDLSVYLFEKFDMTPDQYKAKWGLPASYPMLAPASTLKRGDQFEVDPVTKAFLPIRGQSKPGFAGPSETTSSSEEALVPELETTVLGENVAE